MLTQDKPDGAHPGMPLERQDGEHAAFDLRGKKFGRIGANKVAGEEPVSYTHLTLPTNREV